MSLFISELRFFRQFLLSTGILFVAGELDAAADLLDADRLTVLDQHPDLAILQRPDQPDQLLFRLGQYRFLVRLHVIPS